jgi:sulfite reductase beta subunit-like hemoprotein
LSDHHRLVPFAGYWHPLVSFNHYDYIKMSSTEEKANITVVLPAGRLPLDIMQQIHELATRHGLEIYLSTLQNMRLLNVPQAKVAEIKESLAALGAEFKAPGKFPIPRVCVGKPHCKLGLIDTRELSEKILAGFAGRDTTKAKLKIAVSACVLSCSGTRTSDIGINAGRNGYDVFAGGKGGSSPQIGRRIKKEVNEEEMLATIQTLIDFHDRKTVTKQRMHKLLDDPEFPFAG